MSEHTKEPVDRSELIRELKVLAYTLGAASEDEHSYDFELLNRAIEAINAQQFTNKAEAPSVDLQAEIDRLNAIINSPQKDDFIRAVSTEAEHQRQRWSSEHDSGKAPSDWFWLIGYLAGKALHAHASDNLVKAEHHIITTAAACANWHRSMFGRTDMRPGIDGKAL